MFNIGIKRSEKGGKMARNVSLKFVLKVYHAVRVIKSLLVNFTEKTLKDQGD
jgi:6-phosphogluconate dehydrogenase (decarboxylating)